MVEPWRCVLYFVAPPAELPLELVVLLVVAVAALALSFALRAVLGRAPAVSALAPALPADRWSVRSASTRRPRALAGRFALRAPPPFGLT